MMVSNSWCKSEKVYKLSNDNNVSNLLIVSMIPSDLKELLDVYCFSRIFGGSF